MSAYREPAGSPPAAELLFEIGTEEIPAGFLARAIVDLRALAAERLAALRLAHGEIAVVGAPRRLALSVQALAERQADVSETVTGPPASAAFDKEGKPTKAAAGFAARNNVPVESLTVVEVPGKGAYVAARREQRGEATRTLLPQFLAELARALPWKKSMRWASLDQPFVRPVHWLVALYAGEVIPLDLWETKSGRETRGHRFLNPGAVALDGTLEDYKAKLRRAHVIVDPAARRTEIEAELARVQKTEGVKIRPDEALLDEVTNLVEYPVAIAGSFDEAYLEIPAEVIVSAMRAHQRFFATQRATEKPDGTLDNHFITIAGTITKDPAVVRSGNERVLAARLADARFFFREDRHAKLDDLAARLGGVVFQAKLGTVGDKVGRVGRIAGEVAVALGLDAAAAARAAALCKADLVSKVVGEFPDLQGIMGRHYARLAGEDPAVADAIFEHYLPRGAADELPVGDIGAALGVADRIDTIVGCFAVGLQPTGSADAFGLRRAALALLNILLGRGWSKLRLDALVDAAARELEPRLQQQKIKWTPELRSQILEFFKTRLRGLLVEQKALAADCVDAALAVGYYDVPDASKRAAAVGHLRERPDFEPLGIAFKRVANILKGEAPAGEPDTARFSHDSERALWTSFLAVRDAVAGQVAAHDYDGALRELTTLKPAVDKFFDDVLVMDPDAAVKQNRLNLLGTINTTFMTIADFRQLAVTQTVRAGMDMVVK